MRLLTPEGQLGDDVLFRSVHLLDDLAFFKSFLYFLDDTHDARAWARCDTHEFRTW